MTMAAAMFMFAAGTAGLATPEEWIRRELARPAPLFEFERVRFEFDLVKPPTKNRQSNDRARDGSLPAFPGMSARHHTLLWLGDRRWRIAIDFPGLPDPLQQYHDACQDDSVSWMSGASSLTVTRTEWGFPPGMDPRSTRDDFARWANLLVSGGLNATENTAFEVESLNLDGNNRFHAILRASSPLGKSKYRFDCDWNPDAARGFVRRSTVIEARSSEFVGLTATFGAWTSTGIGDLWLTERAEVEMVKGKEVWIVIPTALTQPSESSIVAALIPPLAGQPDGLRGQVKIQFVEDYRTRQPFVSRADGPRQPLPLLPTMDGRSRAAAWTAASLGGLFVILLAARRRMASRPRAGT